MWRNQEHNQSITTVEETQSKVSGGDAASRGNLASSRCSASDRIDLGGPQARALDRTPGGLICFYIVQRHGEMYLETKASGDFGYVCNLDLQKGIEWELWTFTGAI
ncbi:hypothetical protein RRG08_024737 [Elysia crispata]|uniref:Uncharacterized protein n=1 Tax=Elysia crispata TaxID=231223 RepID=A0AAE0YDP0_9GAST|nr:hypothetical protein RRG08_024737 [Elysia crispata]